MSVEPERVVLTGSPGTGKTTLIDVLRSRGFACFEEPGRRILTSQIPVDGPDLPSNDPERFVAAMLKAHTADHQAVNQSPSFFDRGVPDAMVYAVRFGVPMEPAQRAALCMRYSHVFVLPPWPEIFENDPVRGLSYQATVRVHQQVLMAYREVGYRPIVVPPAPPESRVRFILDSL